MKLVLALIATLGMVSAFAADAVKPVAPAAVAPAAGKPVVVVAPTKAEAAPVAKPVVKEKKDKKTTTPVKSGAVTKAAPTTPVTK